MKKLLSKRGFTLVELLVVMAIIATLVALGLFAINAARQQARNTTRRANVSSARAGLEAYFANNKQYPQVDGDSVTVGNQGKSIYDMAASGGELDGFLASGFEDPNGAGQKTRLCYLQTSVSGYDLWLTAEPAGIPSNCNTKPAAGTANVEFFSQS